jgi:hypothetical protein
VLGSKIKEIYDLKKPCEVDPAKVDKNESVEKNIETLLALVKSLTDCIFNSVEDTPW